MFLVWCAILSKVLQGHSHCKQTTCFPILTFSLELDIQCPILVLCQHSSLNKILYHFIISQAVSQFLSEVSIRTCSRFIGWETSRQERLVSR